MPAKWLKRLTSPFADAAKAEAAPSTAATPSAAPVVSPAPLPPPPQPAPQPPPQGETWEQSRENFFKALVTDDDKEVLRIAAIYPAEVLNWRIKEGTPLKVSQENGALKAFQALAGLGANIDEQFGGRTPLLLAVEKGQKNFVAYLLDKGADLEKTLQESNFSVSISIQEVFTPLGLAIRQGDKDLAVMLVERGADTKAPFQTGFNHGGLRPQSAADYATAKEQFLIADIMKRAPVLRQEYLDRLAAPVPQPEAVVETSSDIGVMPTLRLKTSPA